MAVTSSAANQTQFGTYCTPDEVKDGKHIKTCLADLFTATWLEDLENSSTKPTESINSHLDRVT